MSVLPRSAKPASYYTHPRMDLVEALPRPHGRVLDVGCAGGATGEELLRRGATEVVGIEAAPGAAELARARGYSEVIVGDVEDEATGLDGPFDTILCHDILEHLLHPDAVLRELARVARPDAILSVSAPNARHVSLLYDLAVRGSFNYRLEGHRDSTHIRWFTRKDLIALLEEAGWKVTRVRWADSLRFKPLLLAGGLGREFGTYVWYLQARPAGA